MFIAENLNKSNGVPNGYILPLTNVPTLDSNHFISFPRPISFNKLIISISLVNQ